MAELTIASSNTEYRKIMENQPVCKKESDPVLDTKVNSVLAQETETDSDEELLQQGYTIEKTDTPENK